MSRRRPRHRIPSPPHCRRWLVLCLLSLAVLLPLLAAGQAAAAPPEERPVESVESLLEQAEAAEQAGEPLKAIELYRRIHQRDVAAPGAEEALWRAARLAEQTAAEKGGDWWRQVRDLYKFYITDYADSPRYEAAYFGLAKAYFRMHFYREALIYFKLFQQRFPNSPLLPQVRYWEGTAFLEVGRIEAAREVFRGLAKADDRDLRIKAAIGLGDALYAEANYLKALDAYRAVIAKAPDYYFTEPDLLLKLGRTYCHVGNEAAGRENLFHFLNLAEQDPRRPTVLFELGESFHRQGDEKGAQELYAMAVEAGKPDDRAVILSRFRQAQYRDDPERQRPEWQKEVDLTDPAGDLPYLKVLESFYREPIAQEARLVLLKRYMAREAYDRAKEVAESYLQYDQGGDRRQMVEDIVGRILVQRVEKLLAEGQYQQVYDLYRAEHRHVVAFSRGRLLYLIGQALENLHLYDQASVVYYRALGLPLTDAEKIDLYFRRAEVYLAQQDLASAQRLLKHLRKIYRGTPQIGEIYHLSGRLREAQQRPADALAFYEMAVAKPTLAEKKEAYAADYLRLLTDFGRFEDASAALLRFRDNGWLPPAALQRWAVQVGDGLVRQGAGPAAAAVYAVGIGEGLPADSVAAQRIHLGLGDLAVADGRLDEARSHFEAARSGKDELERRLAEERLRQLTIDEDLSRLGGVLGR